MEHKTYEAALKGDIKHVQEITEQLNLIVTPTKNTLLHVHIAFSRQLSTRFLEQVLEICSPLLVQPNDYGDTPLHVAAKKGLLVVVKVLIKHAKAQHEDLEAQEIAVKQMLRITNNDGNTALHEAAKNHSSPDMVKLLMSKDRDFPYDSANNCGKIPLYIAVSEGSLDVAVEMLRTCTSATYNYKGPNELTILHVAVRRNHPDITRIILEKTDSTKEANENRWSLTKERDEDGWTPLHYAAYYGYHLIVELLVEFDASVASIGDRCRKMTPLHLAAGQGYYNIIDMIINSCPICIEQVDNRGWNYVHFAMCNVTSPIGLRRYDWPMYLLHAKDATGNTPLLVLASISQLWLDHIMRKLARRYIEDTTHCILTEEENFGQLKDEVLELSKVDCKPYKRGVVNLHENSLYKRYDPLETEREMHLVVAALIATVTFTAGLTLPGGYIQEGSDKGTAVLIKNLAFQAFVILDTIALGLSVSAVSFHVVWQFFKSRKYIVLILYAHICTTWALAAMAIAFVTGIYAVLSTSSGLAILTVVVGLSFFVLFYSLIRKHGIRLGFSTRLKFLKEKVCRPKTPLT